MDFNRKPYYLHFSSPILSKPVLFSVLTSGNGQFSQPLKRLATGPSLRRRTARLDQHQGAGPECSCPGGGGAQGWVARVALTTLSPFAPSHSSPRASDWPQRGVGRGGKTVCLFAKTEEQANTYHRKMTGVGRGACFFLFVGDNGDRSYIATY